MSRLPPRLQPLWPVFKFGHRVLSRLLGVLFRFLSRFLDGTGVPRTGIATSARTASLEPAQVTLRSAGAAYRMQRVLPAGDPPGHPAFAAGEQATVPERYLLEVAGGRLSGDYGALVTPADRLDYETSGYFGISDWREHPLYLRPTLGRTEHLSGRVLSLAAPGTATNYYHFLYDAVGRLEILDAAGARPEFDAVIVPHAARYQRELLELVGIDAPLVHPIRGATYSADCLVVPSTPNHHLVAPRTTVDWLRRHLRPTERVDSFQRIYLTRGNAPASRRYVEEDRLWPALEERGFVKLDPGTLSVQDQINAFHSARIVVAPHGAGLSNITFSDPGVRVLELFAPSYVHLGLWSICSAIGGVNYRYLVGSGRRTGGYTNGVLDDISIDPGRVLDVVDTMLDAGA